MNYLSLFSGVGGFELGIQRAFDNPETSGLAARQETATGVQDKSNTKTKHGRHIPTCIGYSEIDKYAIETYEHNWKGHRNYGDATKINERELPDFDLLVGGFPCQAFSVAGKRKGFDDTRGTLFFDIARILKHKRPRHLVLENVKGLLSHDSGKTFQTILGVLTDLGYVVEWQVLNAKDFGVPQNRERIFFVGHLGTCCGRQVFPISGTDSTRIKESPTIIGSSQRHAKVSRDGIVPTLSQAMGQGGGQTPMMVHNIYGGFKETEVRTFENISPTIRTPKGGGHLPVLKEGTRIRRLTPTECERLMSWPDGWTIGSDTQRYKQCGNGVVSNVVQAVIEKLKPCLTPVNSEAREGGE